jgi:3-isopropylmalate dehydrogenase
VVIELAKQYPNVALDFMFIDNAAVELIKNPKQFDVILTENMFGDILSEEASVIVGSVGLLASSSHGEDHSMFEPIHGAYTDAKNKGIANPIASILSAAMLLDHFDLVDEATLVRDAVDKSLNLHITTPDLNTKYNNISTSKVGDFIEDFINNPEETNLNFTNIHLGQSTII